MSTLDYCLQKARQIPFVKNKFRHYCVILDKKGRIVSESANSYTQTHPIMHRTSRKLGLIKDYLHCEVSALIKDKKRKGVKIIVVRVDAQGNSAYSEPCCVCKEIIKMYKNIKSVEYSL